MRLATTLAVLALGAVYGTACASAPGSGSSRASSPVRAPERATSATAGSAVGATSSRGAVEGFMTAVKAADLQAMSSLWGNEKGPARDQFSRDELDKRLIVMQCMLQHDKYAFVEDSPRLQTGGRQAWSVSLSRRGAAARTTLTTVPGPGARWFLLDADLQPLRDFCS